MGMEQKCKIFLSIEGKLLYVGQRIQRHRRIRKSRDILHYLYNIVLHINNVVLYLGNLLRE